MKAITKQSNARRGYYFADQLYEKILESLPRARTQREATAKELRQEASGAKARIERMLLRHG